MDILTPITREEMLMNDEPLTPITREEKILAGEDIECVTRREYFLKKYRHAGGDVMVEGLEVTENGTYTAPEGKAYSPVEVAVPLAEKSVTENGVYNASADSVAGYSKVNVNVPLPENAYLLKDASGALVSFSDGADLPMLSFVCNIDAVQDLHGYDAPWAGGAGKNLANPATATTLYPNGASGAYPNQIRSSSNARSVIVEVSPNTTYTLSKKAGQRFRVAFTEEEPANGVTDMGYEADDTGTTITVTSPSTARYMVVLFWSANVDTDTEEAILATLQIEIGESPTAYAPYENICPISGHNGVDAWVKGKNLASIEDKTLSQAGYLVQSMPLILKAGTYTLSWNTTATSGRIRITAYDAGGTKIADNGADISTKKNTFEVAGDAATISIYANAAADFTNIMLEVGETATTYEPYNTNSQTIQVSWQTEAGEVYGGYVDLVSGVLTVDRICVTLNGFIKDSHYDVGTSSLFKHFLSTPQLSRTDSYANALISNKVKENKSVLNTDVTGAYVAYDNMWFRIKGITDETIFNDTVGNVQCSYKIATPLNYQLTPTQIKSLLGNNNAWCSTGDVDIDYFAKEA